MSIELIQRIHCDECGKTGIDYLESEDESMIRDDARQEGWVMTENGDFCPKCYRSSEVPQHLKTAEKIFVA